MDTTTKRPIGLLVIICLVVFLATLGGEGTNGQRPEGPNLLPAFQETTGKFDITHAKRDAVALSSLCNSIADMIEYDSTRGDNSRLTSGSQLDDLRRYSREYFMRGESFGNEYPSLPKVIGEYLDSEVGTSGGPVDPETRKRWIQAHRQLAKCALWTAQQL